MSRGGPSLETKAAGPDSARGWKVVVAAFVAMFTVFGVAYSFGAFFEPMAREFHSGSGATAAVFAITAFCYFGLGAVSGTIADRIGPRRVLLAGAAVMGGGLLLTSVAPAIWVGYLTYGIGVGVGTACGYVPMVAAVGGWFQRGRSLAIGVAVTGIGLGTLVVGPLAAILIARVGWRQSYALLGAASLVLLGACAMLAERPPRSTRPRTRLAAVVRTREFAVLYSSGLLTSFSLFTAFVHLVPYAQRQGTPALSAATLISVIGGGSIAGRLVLGAVAGRLGAVRSFQLTLAIMVASFPIWLSGPSFLGLALFAFLLGVGYGGWVALSPSVMAELFGADGLGASLGTLYTSAGLGALAGPPFAGVVVDSTGSYRVAIGVATLLGLLALGLVVPLRIGRVESSQR